MKRIWAGKLNHCTISSWVHSPDDSGQGIISTVHYELSQKRLENGVRGVRIIRRGEIIVFPNLYEKVGAKLVQDAVIRVSGKNSARDRDGNLGNEIN